MQGQSQSRTSRGFWALNISQFLGAMNDNIFRWVMAMALVAQAGGSTEPLIIAGIIFAVPFILFSSTAGIISDRYSKRKLIVIINAAEVLIMCLGLLAFLSNNPIIIYCVLFLMLAQSTFFSPCKFGILPEMTPPEHLSYANGLMEAFTHLGIIIGFVIGLQLYRLVQISPDQMQLLQGLGQQVSIAPFWKISVLCIILAIIGLCTSLMIPDTGSKASRARLTPFFWADAYRNIRSCKENRYLQLSLFAIGFFLLLGAFVQINVMPYGMEIFGWAEDKASYLFLCVALGIGIGSYLAGKASHRNVEIGLVPLGALIVSASMLAFAIPATHTPAVSIVLLTLLGFGGGFYIVPLHAYLQQEAPESQRGSLIATSNFLSFCGVAIASLMIKGLGQFPALTPAHNFAIFGLLTLVLSIIVVKILPDFLVRFLGLIITRIIYRIRMHGIENVPTKGAALLVCNHVSYADAALLVATQQRRIRFLAAQEIYQNKYLGWLYRIIGVIPIETRENKPKEIVRSLQEAREALKEGYLVCIFAEGAITRTSYLMGFKKGLEVIMRGVDCPIIPTYIHGMWGSPLSYSNGPLFSHLPDLKKRVVDVSFGPHMNPQSSAYEARQAVSEVGSDLLTELNSELPILPVEFIRVCRKNWGTFGLADSSGKELKFGRMLIGAVALAEAIRPHVEGQKYVGLMVPTSVGASLANFAVGLLGKISVNLNYTSPRFSIESCMKQCDITTVITTPKLLEKIDWMDMPNTVFIEDIAAGITGGDRIKALLRARFAPVSNLYEGDISKGSSQILTVLFSSGSTGEPKGIQLTHANLMSNVIAVQQAVGIKQDSDCLLNFLPFFHSTGFLVGLWLPTISEIGAAHHFNPLEPDIIGELAGKYKTTIMVSTPTFLLPIIRKVKKEQFAHMRLVVTGAEALKPATVRMFKKKFGIEPVQAYGTTELSPVASLNQPGIEVGGLYQESNQPGSIGRTIRGASVQIVDLEDEKTVLGPDESGMIQVTGPGVMYGYLNQPQKTADAMNGKWYITGDVGKMSEDGFITITDRLARFSKLAGEMVPHGVIEEKLMDIISASILCCAVTSLSDKKKGEKLVVLLTEDAGDIDKIHEKLKETDLPNLWVPARMNMVKVDEIPLLGTGKLDLRSIKLKAEELLGEKKE